MLIRHLCVVRFQAVTLRALFQNLLFQQCILFFEVLFKVFQIVETNVLFLFELEGKLVLLLILRLGLRVNVAVNGCDFLFSDEQLFSLVENELLLLKLKILQINLAMRSFQLVHLRIYYLLQLLLCWLVHDFNFIERKDYKLVIYLLRIFFCGFLSFI